MRMGGQQHAPAALIPGMTRPLYMSLGGPQGRFRRVRKISPPPGFDPETFQPVASRHTVFAIPTRLPDYKYFICSLAQHYLHLFYVTSFGPLRDVHDKAHIHKCLEVGMLVEHCPCAIADRQGETSLHKENHKAQN